MVQYSTGMTTKNFITVPSLSHFKHGFFCRHGGVSKGLFSSLDCQLAPPRFLHPHVMDNFACAQKALGLEKNELHTLSQKHGNHVHEPLKGQPCFPEADASVTQDPSIVLAVTTADCVPVLLGDAQTQTVAAVHVGWRGALSHIVHTTLAAMQKRGVVMSHVAAGVGPSIAQEHLLLNADIKEQFINKDPQSAAFFSDHYLDLAGYVVAQLEMSGVEHIDVVPVDTYSNKDFFSARRARHTAENIFGAQPSLIAAGEKS